MFNPDKIRRLFEDRNISQAQFIKDTSISKSIYMFGSITLQFLVPTIWKS